VGLTALFLARLAASPGTIRRPDLFGGAGADLVGGQQQLADPGKDRPQRRHGCLFDAVIDLRDWHDVSLACCGAPEVCGDAGMRR
jgi:hypothetical protein